MSAGGGDAMYTLMILEAAGMTPSTLREKDQRR